MFTRSGGAKKGPLPVHSNLRNGKQGPCGGSEVWPGTRINFLGLGRGLRGGKQAPVWVYAICARVNRRLFGGGCGRRRSLAGYRTNPCHFLYQANFLGLCRGLPQAKRMLDGIVQSLT